MGTITEFKFEDVHARYIDDLEIKRLLHYSENPILIEPLEIFIYKGVTYKKEE